MSPNAIGNAQALQTSQLEELREKLRIKGEVHEKTIAHLNKAIEWTKVDHLEEDTELPPVIAESVMATRHAVRNLSQAQLVLAEYTVNEINSQMANLDEAIAKSKSPIARTTLIR
jgi:hypothetical protein